jgi:rhodanese-related sulfurtransferase
MHSGLWEERDQMIILADVRSSMLGEDRQMDESEGRSTDASDWIEKMRDVFPVRSMDTVNQLGQMYADGNEPWRAEVFQCLTAALTTASEHLAEAANSVDLPLAAWRARNALEIFVWCQYCAKSQRRMQGGFMRTPVGMV